MQYNNKNESIANKLEIISQQINNADKDSSIQTLATIQQAFNEIEEIAQVNEIPILRVIVHWMSLNLEINSDNEQQINDLLSNNSYSNWIDVLTSILSEHETGLLQTIHHSLTSPNWLIKPSAPLLTGLASWLAIVKIENEQKNYTHPNNHSEDDTKTSDSSNLAEVSNEVIETELAYKNDDVISYQIAKAKEANDETLFHQTVFEEINPEIFEKDYSSTEFSEDYPKDETESEVYERPPLETEKSSLDDDNFEKLNVLDLMNSKKDDLFDNDGHERSNVTINAQTRTKLTIEDELLAKNESLFESLINTNKYVDSTDIEEERIESSKSKSNNTHLENELSTIYQRLIGINLPSKDIFSANDKLIKQIDDLILLTNESTLNAITPIAEWSKRNLQLFEKNTTGKIESFIKSGEAWSWINQIQICLNGSDTNSCLNDLTNCLTNEEWLEPVDTIELEALLICVKAELDGHHDELSSSKVVNEEKIDIHVTDESALLVDDYVVDFPELSDAPNTVENDLNQLVKKATSGLKMTWDDDTHPELLMVYLEETPTQIEELIPLLNLISKKHADQEKTQTAARLAHTIKGGSAVVGITALAELSGHLETILDYSNNNEVSEDILRILPKVGSCLESVLNAVQLQSEEPSEFLTIFDNLDSYVSSIDIEDKNVELTSPELPDFILQQNDLLDNDLIDNSLIVEDQQINQSIIKSDSITNQNKENSLEISDEELLEDLVADLDTYHDIDSFDKPLVTDASKKTEDEIVPTEKSGFQLNWDDDTHPELLMVYLEETPTQINELVPLLHKISSGSADEDEKHVASRIAHTIKGASAIVGITALSEISYRLETLLDHSIKYQLPDEILTLLPDTASCLEKLFDAVQMQDEEPSQYFSIFKQLDNFVSNIEESNEPLELSAPVLPEFIINQNKINDETIEDESVQEVLINESVISEINFNNETAQEEAIADEKEPAETLTERVNIEQNDIDVSKTKSDVKDNDDTFNNTNNNTNSIIGDFESPSSDITHLDKLKSPENVIDIIEEINSIVMNLVTISTKSESINANLNDYLTELQRFDIIVDISGYPELSLLSQWCQSNLELFAKEKEEATNSFVSTGHVWSWIEFVGATLNEPDDMSHMSSLSVELMRDDWLQAIEMDDLQTVLLALRNIDEADTTADAEYVIETTNSNEIISWDKDIHPELLAVYFSETPDQINQVAELLHIISKGESTTEENKKAARIAHTIKGASGVVGLNSLVDLTHSLEDILDYSVNNTIPNETAELLAEASDCLESLFESIQNKQVTPEELPSVLKRLSKFSASLSDESSASNATLNMESNVTENKYIPAIDIFDSSNINNFTESTAEQKRAAKININETTIRVPVSVINNLINLAGELVTTSSQVSDNLAKTIVTNKTIRTQDERVHNMLSELTNTIVEQEKDQQNLLSSLENSDFDSLEMDTYNELHSVVSLLSESISDSQEIDLTLNKQLNELTDKLRSLDKLNKDFSEVILSSRMVSINTIIPRLERIVRQTCRKTNKKAQLVVTGKDINIDTDILNGLVDPLLHMLRNSIDHGIESPEERNENNKDETGIIELSFIRDGNNILMELKDDGAGIDPEVIYQKAIHKDLISPNQEISKSDTLKLILQPGFTTQENITDISGRGVGMDVVNNSVENLNGSLSINSEIGEGTTFNLTIPVTLITNTTLMVKAANNTVAIPTETIEQILYQEANNVIKHDETFFVMYEDEKIEIKSLAKLLGWQNQEIDFTKSYNVLIIRTENKIHAIHIDSIISSREVVVKPLSPWVTTTKGVIGACHLNDGGVSPVINLLSVLKQAKSETYSLSATEKAKAKMATKAIITPKILVVDDSLSNRKALSLIIEKTYFEVITAVDGMDALKIMNENTIDLVFTDLEMPRMNGLELTQAIRAWSDKSKIPIVMITSRTTSKHRELAAKAGVDDYLTKPVVTETLLESIDTWLVNKVTATV